MGSLATLTGALLVRKGEARPTATLTAVSGRADGAPANERTARARRGPAGGGSGAHPVAMTLRLDPARHRRLRLFAACTERSMQAVLVAALDDYLARACADDDLGCACLRLAPPEPSESG